MTIGSQKSFLPWTFQPNDIRWYMASVKFCCAQSIAGVGNYIADALLRLSRNNMLDSPTDYTEQETYSASISENLNSPSQSRQSSLWATLW